LALTLTVDKLKHCLEKLEVVLRQCDVCRGSFEERKEIRSAAADTFFLQKKKFPAHLFSEKDDTK